MKQCAVCKNEIPDLAKFCPQCGAKAEPRGKTCPNPECDRTGLPPDAVYCPDCGFKLAGSKAGFASFTETVGGVSFEMVAVEGGVFMMGSPFDEPGRADDELPHQVTLSNYYIGKTVVTQALWRAVMGKNPSCFHGDNLPVEQVKWKHCQDFIQRLNRLTHKIYSLPTEAQWEYAARGGIKSRGCIYAGSNHIDEVAWYRQNSGIRTNPVGMKQPNELGLYDMSGNVSEWCEDWYGKYPASAQTDPLGPSSGSYRVYRGGHYVKLAADCRVAKRDAKRDWGAFEDLGFRLALAP